MKEIKKTCGIEINPKFVAACFTEQIENKLRVFCFFANGGTSQFELSAEENLRHLQSFYSKLNTDDTCSSVILDEVVQGRVYVRSGKNCLIYTLLSTPGNGLPSFDGDIGDLPWTYCWRSQAVDVLEYGKPGDPGHCFAIRTQISENDAQRLVKESKAFTNPLSVRKRKPHRRLYLAVGVVLVLLGMLIGLTIFYNFKPKASNPIPAVEVIVEPRADTYYLLCNHQITGPYPVGIVSSLQAGGLLNPETMCRSDKSTEWVGLTTLFPAQSAK